MSLRKWLTIALCLLFGPAPLSRTPLPQAHAEDKPAKGKTSRTDFYGDPLPENALARLSTVRLRHSNTVSAIRFTPDSTRIIVASPGVRPALDHGEPSIRIWETASGKLVRGIAFPESRNGCLALTPDGKTLAVEVARGSINLVDLGTGKILRQLGPRKREITALAFAPNGKTLAATVEDILLPLPGQGLAFRRQGQMVMWDVGTGRSLHQFALPAKACCLAWSPNGKAIATGSSQGVALWDAASGKQRWHLAGAVSGAYAVACSPDGKVLAIGGEDGSLRLAALASGKVLCRFQRHRSPIHAVAFSADGKRLACGSDNGFLRLWDTTTRKETYCLQGFHRAVTAVAFAPDGKTLASGGSDQTVKLWDPATGKERLPSSGHTGIVWSVAWSPTGKLVASGDSQRVIAWDPATGREVWRLPAPPAVSALAFSPDGKTLATVGWDGTIRLAESATGKLVRSMRGREPRLLAVAWSPDGKLLACGGDEGSVPLWDVTTGKEIRRMHSSRPRTDVSCVAFSPDGRFLVTGTDENTTPLFEVATGHEVLRLTGHTSRTVDAAFSPDGRTLATGHADNSVRLWNVHTGKERRRLTGHTGTVAAVAFTRDGRVLLSGSDDGTIRMWEMASGGGVLCFRGHAQGVTSIAVSPDGRRVVSGSRDSTALVWDVTGLGPDQGPEQPLSPGEQVGLWQGLADTDAAVAHRVVWRLAASPRQAVRLVGGELTPVKGVSSERLARLVDELDHDHFRVRQRASEELERLGEVAVPELYRRLANKSSLELRYRAGKLLEKADPRELPPRRLREVRALGVLERAGTAEARQVLRSLAGGASGAWLTVEARAALQRLSRLEAK